MLEHPNPTPAPPSAAIALSVTLPSAVVAGESYQVLTVGAWSQHGLAPAVGAAALTDTFAYTGTSTITNRPLDKVTLDDAVLVLRYSADQLTALLDTTLDMVDGTNLITGGMSSIAIDQNLAATVDPATAITRLGTPQPANATPTLNWSLVAAPGFAVANTSGAQLRAGAVLATDTAIALPYGNPFTSKSWHPVFTFAPTVSRTFTTTDTMLPVTLAAQLVQLLDAGPGTAITADLPAGLPQVTTLAGTALATDGMTVVVDPTLPVDASFTTDVASNTFYQLQLFELVPDATNTVLQLQIRISMSAIGPQFTLPANLLVAGKTYVLRAICISGGYPGLAQGDLRMRTLPFSLGFADCGVFTVRRRREVPSRSSRCWPAPRPPTARPT